MLMRRTQQLRRSQRQRANMTTLALIAAAVLLGGFLLMKSNATALPGFVEPRAATKNDLLIQKTGCLLAGRYCGVGFHWVCGLPPNPERRRCHCVTC